MWDYAQQIVRILLQILAGMLYQRGYITEDMSQQLVAAGLSLAGIAWWAVWANKTNSAVKIAKKITGGAEPWV